MAKNRFYQHIIAKSVTIKHKSDEQETNPKAAYTPSQMAEAFDNGLPINSDSCLRPEQGSTTPSWDVPLMYQRGTDVSDLWSAERDAKHKVSQAYTEQYAKDADAKKAKQLKLEADAARVAELEKQVTNPKQ